WLLVLPLGITLALLPPAVVFPLFVAVAGTAVLLVRPRWGLYALALTVPYQGLFDFKYQDVSVSITEAVVALVLVAWLTLVIGRRARPAARSPLLGAIAALLVCFALTVFIAPNINLAAKEMLKWIELAVVYLAGTSLIETPAHRRMLLVWLLAAGASQALVGLVQSVLRVGPEHFMIGGLIMRAYGTFEQPNPFGGYLGLTVPLAVSIAIFGLGPGIARRLVIVAALVTGLALSLTLSRGAWTAQLVALALVFAISSVRARQALGAGVLFAAVLLGALWPLIPPEVSDRLTSIVVSAVDLGSVKDSVVTPDNWAVLERLSQWYAGWEMFLDNPILGVGIGNYNAAYETYRLEQWPVALGHAHNHYLTIAAEAGFVGFLAYVLFWVVVFRACAAALRYAPNRLERAVVVGILSSLAAFATHNLFDVLFGHGMGVTLGLLLTLLHGAGITDRPASAGG
ncbi:MAG TPA: O-antigen ligase family protein, partial [Chloroflexota bacterium]|nr:O-antigen ligase family protein [Chloroflexota bacterium]